MDSYELTEWLLNNGGPVIRFRTMVEIQEEQDIGKISGALDKLMDSSIIQKWLSRLVPGTGFNQIHSSKPEAFENAMGKLTQLGLHAGLQPFDSLTLPFRVWLSESIGEKNDRPFSVFAQTLVAAFLALARYDDLNFVDAVLKQRLKTIYSFAEDPDFSEIYDNRGEFGTVPKGLAHHRLVKPNVFHEQQFMLPWIHDVMGFANSRNIMEDIVLRDMAERVVGMTLFQEYQEMPSDYGVMRHGTRCYVIGWGIDLPGYNGVVDNSNFAKLLFRLEMMAPFRVARNSDWFERSMAFLETHRIEKGIYRFPRVAMHEKRSGYWVNGAYMAMEEERKSQLAIDIESTFMMTRIKRLARY